SLGIDTDHGLAVLAMPDAGDLSLGGLEHRINDLRRHAAEERAPEVRAVASLVVRGVHSPEVLWEAAALPPGQLGLLNLGSVVERPVIGRAPDAARSIGIRAMA